MHIGVIADDLTGATDIAGFLAGAGLETLQVLGQPGAGIATNADAVVISLKTRSILADQAVGESLRALDWLLANGCKQVYFKYCSTFDSTEKGNIGPVTDALLVRLGEAFTVICPSLPINGRTVRNGILLVNGVPLAETGMRHHPINPMTESDLTILMDKQSTGKTGLVNVDTVLNGSLAVQDALSKLENNGYRYAVLDAETDAELDILATATASLRLLTGGSGLGAARARLIAAALHKKPDAARTDGRPRGSKRVALSGSCSEMTNRQVAVYKETSAPTIKAEAERCVQDPAYADELADWVQANANGPLAPLVYATVDKEELRAIQERFGAEPVAKAVELLFSRLTTLLRNRGFDIFIVAGGETSGSVVEALGGGMFRLGPDIAPGVPWIRSIDGNLSLALKSGNFGDERFFTVAQEFIDNAG